MVTADKKTSRKDRNKTLPPGSRWAIALKSVTTACNIHYHPATRKVKASHYEQLQDEGTVFDSQEGNVRSSSTPQYPHLPTFYAKGTDQTGLKLEPRLRKPGTLRPVYIYHTVLTSSPVPVWRNSLW